MKKLFIILCCTALLLVGLFHVPFIVPTTAKPVGEDSFASPWQNAKAMNAKMLTAQERDSADAIKRLPGIADAIVITTQRPEWERNVWARRNQVVSVDVSVEACDNQPIDVVTIQMIRKIVASLFGTTPELVIFDAKFNKMVYGSAGVEITDDKPQTAVDLAGPDIGKFRLPITYLLHNIPAESLIDFLAEEFPQVETEVVDNGFPRPEWILITASLTDHRTIMKMLTDLKREIESIGNEAAEG